jgi:RNA polymerase primary sigma factor
METYDSLVAVKSPLFLDDQEPDVAELEDLEEDLVDVDEEKEVEVAVVEDHSDDAIKLYLREIQKTKLLTVEEERELAARVEKGEKAARDRMIVSNLRLVVKISKRYVNRGLPFLDLIEEGNLGLIKAVERFKLAKECRFSTYATWWIRQSIERALVNQSRTIRLPVHVSDDINRMLKGNRELLQKLHREPTLFELSDQLGQDINHVRKLMVLLKKTYSIDQPMGDGGDYFLTDTIEDTSMVSPETLMEEINSYELACRLMQNFTDTEKKILSLRFGLGDTEPQTLDTIGQSFGVTRERIRQIEAKALMKLRRMMSPPEPPPQETEEMAQVA